MAAPPQFLSGTIPPDMQQQMANGTFNLNDYDTFNREGINTLRNFDSAAASAWRNVALYPALAITTGGAGGSIVAAGLARLGASTALITFGSGAAAGATGDATFQGLQLVIGDRQSFSATHLGANTLLGGGVTYGANCFLHPEPVLGPSTTWTRSVPAGTGETDIYRADGLLTQELQGGQYYQFGYDDYGLLIFRLSPWTTWAAVQRDGRGRMVQQEVIRLAVTRL